MSDLINDISQATRGLSNQQRLDTVLAQLSDTRTPLAEGDAVAGPVTPASAGELVEPLSRINEVMRSYGIEFHVNDYDNRTVTRIVDRDSGDVIRQIPAEEVLRIAERLGELQGRLIHFEA